jgi:hypothetical protein
VSTEEKLVSLGSKKIVTVRDGEVGISYNKGKLVVCFFSFSAIEKKKKYLSSSTLSFFFSVAFKQVLKPERHVIDSAGHTFQGEFFPFLVFFFF